LYNSDAIVKGQQIDDRRPTTGYSILDGGHQTRANGEQDGIGGGVAYESLFPQRVPGGLGGLSLPHVE
jgi:hypothetical protein